MQAVTNNESMMSIFSMFPDIQKDIEKGIIHSQKQVKVQVLSSASEKEEQAYGNDQPQSNQLTSNTLNTLSIEKMPYQKLTSRTNKGTTQQSKRLSDVQELKKVQKYEQFRNKIRDQVLNSHSKQKLEKSLQEQLDKFLSNTDSLKQSEFGTTQSEEFQFCTFNSPREFNRLSAPIVTSLSKQKLDELHNQFGLSTLQQSPTPRFTSQLQIEKSLNKEIASRSKQKIQSKIKQTLLNQDLDPVLEVQQSLDKTSRKTVKDLYGSMLNEYFPTKTGQKIKGRKQKQKITDSGEKRAVLGMGRKAFNSNSNSVHQDEFRERTKTFSPQNQSNYLYQSGCSVKDCQKLREKPDKEKNKFKDGLNVLLLSKYISSKQGDPYSTQQANPSKIYEEQPIMSQRNLTDKFFSNEGESQEPMSTQSKGFSSPQSKASDQYRMNLLAHTSSIDHYLSNGTTFLKGQRCSEVIDKQCQRVHLRNYFSNFIVKKIQQVEQRELKEALQLLISMNIQWVNHRKELLDRIIVHKEESLKSLYLRKWNTIASNLSYRRKGFAVQSLVHILQQQRKKNAFNRINNYSLMLQIPEEQIVERINQRLIRLTLTTWIQTYNYRQLEKKRANMFFRTLEQVQEKVGRRASFQKLKQQEEFKNLNLHVSLNLKIRELIMSALSEFTKRQTRDKLYKLIGLQKLESLSSALTLKNKSAFLENLKEQSRRGQTERIQILQSQAEINELKINSLESKHAVMGEMYFKLASKQLAATLRTIMKTKKSEALSLFKQNSQEMKRVIKVRSFLAKYDHKFKLGKSFKKWREHSNQASHISSVNIMIQQNLIQRMLSFKAKQAFLQWRRATFMIKLRELEVSHSSAENKQHLPRLISSIQKSMQLKLQLRGFQSLLRNKSISYEVNAVKSSCLVVATQIYQIVVKKENKSLKRRLNKWKELVMLSHKYQQSSNRNIECLVSTLKELEHQRYHFSFSKLSQLYFIRKHQTGVLEKLAQKQKKKRIQEGIKLLKQNVQLYKKLEEQAGFKKLQSLHKVKAILSSMSCKSLSRSFHQWAKFSDYITTSIKVSNAIKTMIATTKISAFFNQYGAHKQAFTKWVKLTQAVENTELGLQIVSNFQRKKLKLCFMIIKNQLRKQSLSSQSQRIKVSILYQTLQKQMNAQVANSFSKVLVYSINKRLETEKKRLKQKKSEIHNQIVYLSERDIKIRSQEAQLSMKESRILEKEKELKEKSKRLAEISKSERERKKSLSKSPSRYAVNMPQSSTNKLSATVKFQNMKSQMDIMNSIAQQPQSQCQPHIPPIRMDVISSIQSDIEKVSQKINSVNYPFQKYNKDLKSSTQFYSANSFASNGTQQLNKENSSSTSSIISKNIASVKKSSYLSSANPNMSASVVSIDQLSARNDKKVESMKQKLFRQAFERLISYQSTSDFNNKAVAFAQLRRELYLDQKLEGARRINDYMNRKVLSQCLINWLRSIYEEEIQMQESIENRRLHKLYQAVLIVEKSKRREDVLLVRYFKEWKRMGFQNILQGLRQYSETVNINRSRVFPAKRGHFNH